MINKNSLILFTTITVVGLAISTTMLTYHSTNTIIKQKDLAPDAVMEDMTALIMDKQGNPKIKIVTPKMVHFAENDTSHLTTPRLTLYRQSPQPWYVTSKYAKATQGIENVDFWDDVIIRHPEDQKNPATTIKTSTLTVHPNKETAETNELITMSQPNLIVTATGMHADMNSGNIKLLMHARGEYVPGSS